MATLTRVNTSYTNKHNFVITLTQVGPILMFDNSNAIVVRQQNCSLLLNFVILSSIIHENNFKIIRTVIHKTKCSRPSWFTNDTVVGWWHALVTCECMELALHFSVLIRI